MNFIKKLFTMYYYLRAVNFLQNENDQKAYEYFSKIDKSIIKKIYPVQYCIFLGFTALSLRKINESEVNLNEAIQLIENSKKLDLNIDEKNYLKYYTLNLLINLYKHLGREIYSLKNEYDSLKDKFNKNNINSILLNHFPVN